MMWNFVVHIIGVGSGMHDFNSQMNKLVAYKLLFPIISNFMILLQSIFEYHVYN